MSKKVQIKFIGHSTSNGVVIYKVQLYDPRDSAQWMANERYSSMRDVSKQLEKEYAGQMPEFPPKKWFGNMDEKFINQREKALENYFNNAISIVNLEQSLTLKEFLFKGRNNTGSPIIPDDDAGRSMNNSTIDPPKNNLMNKSNPQPQQMQKKQNAIEGSNNQQDLWKAKMEKIVSQVPFIDSVQFSNLEHNNQDYKRNIYNQIKFERKSKLLQAMTIQAHSGDLKERTVDVPIDNVNFLQKLDIFAEKMHKALTTPLSNIYCDIVQNPKHL